MLLEGCDRNIIRGIEKDMLSGVENSVLFYAFRELSRRFEIIALERVKENMKFFCILEKTFNSCRFLSTLTA